MAPFSVDASAGFFPGGAFSAGAAGTTAARFLQNPFGARAAAMGDATAASAQGAEALFQNPAALSRFAPGAPSEVALGYDALIETAYQGAAAYAQPLGGGALGAGVVYASQSPQTAYTAAGNSSGSFTPLEFAAGAGYARRLGSVAVGGAVKAIHSSLSDQSGTTAAVDAGVYARNVGDLGDGVVDLGGALSNLGPPLKVGANADPLPFAVRAGALWRASPTFDAALDLVLPVDQDPYVALGAEERFVLPSAAPARPWIAAVRAGYDFSRARDVDGFAGVSVGGGLDFAALRVDYAWVALGALGSANRVTLAFRF